MKKDAISGWTAIIAIVLALAIVPALIFWANSEGVVIHKVYKVK